MRVRQRELANSSHFPLLAKGTEACVKWMSQVGDLLEQAEPELGFRASFQRPAAEDARPVPN